MKIVKKSPEDKGAVCWSCKNPVTGTHYYSEFHGKAIPEAGIPELHEKSYLHVSCKIRLSRTYGVPRNEY